jgi:hypothetical protein
MSCFSSKKKEIPALPPPAAPADGLEKFALELDDGKRGVKSAARYMRTSNFRYSGGEGVPYAEYLEAVHMPESGWLVQKVTLHEMLVPNSGMDKGSAVSSIAAEASGLGYFEAVYRLAVYEQAQLPLHGGALERVAEKTVPHYYADIARRDGIAFDVIGMPGLTVEGRPVGRQTYAQEELGLMQQIEEARRRKVQEKENAAAPPPEKPAPTLGAAIEGLSGIFSAVTAEQAADTKRMALLLELQGTLFFVRDSIALGQGVWSGGSLENAGAYGFRRNRGDQGNRARFGDSGDYLNRWSLRGTAFTKFYRALKAAEDLAVKQAGEFRAYPDLQQTVNEAGYALQCILVMWLAQTTRQEWSGCYALNKEPNKKDASGEAGAPIERGSIETFHREFDRLEWRLNHYMPHLSEAEKEKLRASIPLLLREITQPEFGKHLKEVCGRLKTVEDGVRDYLDRCIDYATRPPETEALPLPEAAHLPQIAPPQAQKERAPVPGAPAP